MAAQVKWTPRAQDDLIHIYQYHSEYSIVYAAQFVNELIRTVSRQLSTFPLSGRKIPELVNSPLNYLREIVYKNFRIIYNPLTLPSEIRIITVHSSRMDLLSQSETWIL